MSKRKWEEISRRETFSDSHPNASVGLQRHQVEGLLEQGKRALSQSLEFARYPERQKLSRRQKTAKTENNEAEIARLDAEVAALKVGLHGLSEEFSAKTDLVEIRTGQNSRITPLQIALEDKVNCIPSFSPTICTDYRRSGTEATGHGVCECAG